MKLKEGTKVILFIWGLVFLFILITFLTVPVPEGFGRVRFLVELVIRIPLFAGVSFVILASLISAIAYIVFNRFEKKRYLKKAEYLSFKEGGVKNKQIHRTLEEYEKVYLEHLHRKTGDSKYDLDRRSPVFKVQGKLYKQEGKRDRYVEIPEKWYVKGLEINESNYPPLRFKHFNENDELVVEFSSHSGYVWDVYRVFGTHKNWFMYLAPEIFDQLIAEKIKVVGRAPFGKHYLKEIKNGDVITFSHIMSGRRVDTKIKEVSHYDSAKDMVEKEGLKDLLPEAKNASEVVSFYESLYNYKGRIAKGGIYAFRVSLLDSNKNKLTRAVQYN